MYRDYKPLRNRLRQFRKADSIHSIYKFFLHFDFNETLPENLSNWQLNLGVSDLSVGIFPWFFEILLREVILNSPERSPKALDNWSDISKCNNAILAYENNLWKLRGADDDIFFELVRISHRQFPWQKGISTDQMARYAMLYDDKKIAEMISTHYKMTVDELFQIGLSLAGHFLSNFTIDLPIKNELNNVPEAITNRFVDKFSISMEELEEEYSKLQQFGLNWPYTFNPLRTKPLIVVDKGQRAICPIPSFLIRRFTNEIYYDLITERDNFSRYFGPGFQKLCEELAKSHFLGRTKKVIGETRYGSKKRPKDTVDIILVDDTATLFVECKASRVKFRGISDLEDRNQMEAEFSRIKDFAVQCYRSVNDAINGHYPNWDPNDKPKFIVLVTLEDWQTFGVHIQKLVFDPLKSELAKLGINPKIVDDIPLSMCPVDVFEACVGVANQVGIRSIFEQKSQGEHPQWALETFLHNNFIDELRTVSSEISKKYAERFEEIGNVN